MKGVAEKMGKLTGWKDKPASVFDIAIPLFLFAMFAMLFVAVQHARLEGDYGYLISGALVLLVVGYPVTQMALQAIKLTKSDS